VRALGSRDVFDAPRRCHLSWPLAGNGAPLLLIQGTGVGGETWRPQIDALQEEFACLSFDNRGFGASQPLAGALSVERMADDAIALMDAQGWETAHVAGHSLGGLVAQFVANKVRRRVRSLSLLCTISKGADATTLTGWHLRIGLRTAIGTKRMRRRAFLEMVFTEAEIAELRDFDGACERLACLYGHDLATQPSISMKQLRAMAKADATPFLRAFAGLPTLVVTATHDRITRPACGRAIAAAIPGARYVELDSARAAPITRSTELNAVLREHLVAVEREWRAASVAAG